MERVELRLIRRGNLLHNAPPVTQQLGDLEHIRLCVKKKEAEPQQRYSLWLISHLITEVGVLCANYCFGGTKPTKQRSE